MMLTINSFLQIDIFTEPVQIVEMTRRMEINAKTAESP